MGDAFSTNLKTGDEVLAIDPGIVLGIDFETAEQKVVIDRRRGTRGQFSMAVTTSRTGEVKSCKADSLMHLLVASFSSIRVDRSLTPAEAKELWRRHGQNAALLRIRDTIATDPKVFQVVFVDPGSSIANAPVVVFRDQASLFVPSIRGELFEALKAGCVGSSSSRKSPR